MDPTVNAQQQYRLACAIICKLESAQWDELIWDEGFLADVSDLAEYSQSLLEWMAKGGFPPKADLLRDVVDRVNARQ